MIKKTYEKFKIFMEKEYKFIIFVFILYVGLTYPLPYYIHTNGGLINVTERIEINNQYEKSGSINLSYVSEIKGTVLTYLLSFIIPNWDLKDGEEKISSNESYEDTVNRSRILLEEANANAAIVAYQKAGKEVKINSSRLYIVSVDEEADNSLEVGDEVISINKELVSNIDEYREVVSKYNEGDVLIIEVIDKNNKKKTRKAKIFVLENYKLTGVYAVSNYDYETVPDIEFNFKKSEMGPSGGLMTSLAIYNKLSSEDLTKGLTVVGTGTIDIKGNVGEIGGVEYKLKGAVNAKADLFIVPIGENYDEVIKLVKANNYKIKIVGVSTFDEALKYLKDM